MLLHGRWTVRCGWCVRFQHLIFSSRILFSPQHLSHFGPSRLSSLPPPASFLLLLFMAAANNIFLRCSIAAHRAYNILMLEIHSTVCYLEDFITTIFCGHNKRCCCPSRPVAFFSADVDDNRRVGLLLQPPPTRDVPLIGCCCCCSFSFTVKVLNRCCKWHPADIALLIAPEDTH